MGLDNKPSPVYSRRNYEDFVHLLSYTDDKDLIERIIHFFIDDNPKFDRVRFRTNLHQQTQLRREREFMRTMRPELEAGVVHDGGDSYVGE